MQRTVVSKLFGYFVSSSGINETEAPYYGFDVDSVTRTFHARTFFEVENNFEVTLKLVFDKETRVIMGGQIIYERSRQFGDHQYGLYVDHILHDS